jgi:hypothetical protein
MKGGSEARVGFNVGSWALTRRFLVGHLGGKVAHHGDGLDVEVSQHDSG